MASWRWERRVTSRSACSCRTCWPPVLPGARDDSSRRRVRQVRREALLALLSSGDRATGIGAGELLPIAAGGLLRGNRQRARDRRATGRLVESSRFPRAADGQGTAGSLDDLARRTCPGRSRARRFQPPTLIGPSRPRVPWISVEGACTLREPRLRPAALEPPETVRGLPAEPYLETVVSLLSRQGGISMIVAIE